MSLNILIVPGYHDSGDAHWQTWLEQVTPDSKRVTGIDWEQPILHNWAKAIVHELDASPQPAIIVAHSFGCLASALAIANRPQQVAGVILVAPADPEHFTLFGPRNPELSHHASIAPCLPENSLETPGLLIGSRNDPWMKLQHAYAWSKRWQLAFHNAGNAGHINVNSGFGPWPLIRLIAQSLGDLTLSNASTAVQNKMLTKLTRRAPTPAIIFNQQYLLYA